jgi:hypothetical protein
VRVDVAERVLVSWLVDSSPDKFGTADRRKRTSPKVAIAIGTSRPAVAIGSAS